jgi:phosphoenolpyruvate carboxylase
MNYDLTSAGRRHLAAPGDEFDGAQLKRYRAGDTAEAVMTGIHPTISAIAAGLRNSG